MRKFSQGGVHLSQRAAKRGQQQPPVRLNLSQAVAVKPAKQTDEMLPSPLIFDSGNGFSSPGGHEARKFQIGVAGAEKLNQLILQLEDSNGLLANGNLEDIFLPISANLKILVTFARQRRRGTFDPIKIEHDARRLILS